MNLNFNITNEELESDWEPNTYGTPQSKLLQQVIDAGFKPIAITTMICEETFVFKNDIEAKSAWEKFKPEGWWYGYSTFIDARKKYIKDLTQIHSHEALDYLDGVYWLDKNYAPKGTQYE